MKPAWFLALIFVASPIVPKDCNDPGPVDADSDGFPDTEDCDDNDASVFPGAVEVCGDGIDNDCDGEDIPCPTFQYISQGRAVSLSGQVQVSDGGPEQSFDIYEESEGFAPFSVSLTEDVELVEVFSAQDSRLEGESIWLSGASVASAYGAGSASEGFAYTDSVATVDFVLVEAQTLELQGYIEVETPTGLGHPVAGVAFTGPGAFNLAHQVVVDDTLAWSTTFEAPPGSYSFSVYSVTDINLWPGEDGTPEGIASFYFLLTPASD